MVLIITDTFRENSTSLIDEIVAPLNEAQIPFSSTQGVSRRRKVTSFVHLTIPNTIFVVES